MLTQNSGLYIKLFSLLSTVRRCIVCYCV